MVEGVATACTGDALRSRSYTRGHESHGSTHALETRTNRVPWPRIPATAFASMVEVVWIRPRIERTCSTCVLENPMRLRAQGRHHR